MKVSDDAYYWENRYQQHDTAWDAGQITAPLKAYVDQLPDRQLRILVPGCGRAYEAEYLFKRGYRDVCVVDLAPTPLANLLARCPDFPPEHLWQRDFFDLDEPSSFDLILEQTFFCALDPALRPAYARQCARLLRPGGKLVGVLFEVEFPGEGPPFGGNREEYRGYFEPHFHFRHFEHCTNSIPPRAGRELFILLEKKSAGEGQK